jgi:hypothetical protein
MTDAELLDRAKGGQLSREELDGVAAALLSHETTRDAYTLIHILGRGGATWHEELVAGFLNSPHDPMLARIALQVLCSHWGLAKSYRDSLATFALRVPWDTDDDVRLVGLSQSGELIRTSPDAALTRILLDTFRDPSEEDIVRDAAYSALARASGREWSEIPPASRLMDRATEVDASVLSWAEKHASTP